MNKLMVAEKKPVIGVCMNMDKRGLVRTGVHYSLIRRDYGEQIKAAGGSPIFLDNTIDAEVAAALCDGIIISGGEDIDPSFYGQAATHVINTEPMERTLWERLLIDACDKQGVIILGICYGSQLLNVHYGGTLFQDIAIETGSTLSHGTSATAAYHDVIVDVDFLGYKKGDIMPSASRHHQAVKDIAPGFKVVARAEDNVIEAIAGFGHYGVQWHAESDGTAHKIYGSFINLVSDNPSKLFDVSNEPELAGEAV